MKLFAIARNVQFITSVNKKAAFHSIGGLRNSITFHIKFELQSSLITGWPCVLSVIDGSWQRHELN